jgi:hypothetical protein
MPRCRARFCATALKYFQFLPKDELTDDDDGRVHPQRLRVVRGVVGAWLSTRTARTVY